MALSPNTIDRLKIALTDEFAGQEVADQIASGGNPVAASVAALGATADLSAAAVTPTVIPDSNFTAANPVEPTKAEIDVGIDTLRTATVTALDLKADNEDLETMRTESEARLDDIEAKLDAIISALKTAGLMAS